MERNKIEIEAKNRLYMASYNGRISQIDITDSEFNIFLDIIYQHTVSHHLEKSYEGVLHVIFEHAMYLSLFDKPYVFNLYYLIQGLNDLSCFNFDITEINEMENEIRKKTRFGKILKLNI